MASAARVQEIAVWTLFLFLVAMGAIDLVLAFRFGSSFTISWTVLEVSKAHPVVPLLAGIVLGHLFWPQAPTDTPVQSLRRVPEVRSAVKAP